MHAATKARLEEQVWRRAAAPRRARPFHFVSLFSFFQRHDYGPCIAGVFVEVTWMDINRPRVARISAVRNKKKKKRNTNDPRYFNPYHPPDVHQH